ncbi:exodeoxyribonuclease V subunit alpha [Propionivibrio limicola]|uniref:exodeoxyribonuclease V subunit alpha n=1 Tax=Propionivibrio limicola TaxID=167645 RepID=UPI001B85FB71|nr:exodeoxyribonuclease V subunit alpha [Propionivibrio limicola]
MTDSKEMLALLEQWVERGWLREVDLALVRFFIAEVPETPPALMLATALVSHQLGRGHVCLDLENTLLDPYMALSLPPEQEDEPNPDQAEIPQPCDLLAGWTPSGWISALNHPELVSDGQTRTPLVLVGHRLYLRRYWRYERQVEQQIQQRIENSAAIASEVPEAELKTTLNALFPPADSGKTDWQKIACALAARSAFSIITGGPGTGKTTTVVRLLALLQSIALAKSSSVDNVRPLQIRLAAPTGKAAARLKESISGAISKLPGFVQENADLKASIPTEVTTLHRLLGTRPDSRTFRHNARNPLPLDVLVIDEGSMVDLEMMAALLMALPPHARLVLLGDKDQLASVEAGSVLGELCRRARAGHFLPETVRWIEAMTGETVESSLCDDAGLPLDQHVVMLRESRRFDASSGIGQLADAVNAGNTDKIHEVFAHGYGDLRRHDFPTLEEKELESILLGDADDDASPQGLAGLAGYLNIVRRERPPLDADKAAFDAWATKVLNAHGRFQLLCALRNGPFGVKGMNLRIESLLHKRKLIQPGASWYEGRPVLVTRNDYRLELMNGDIGIALSYPVRNKASGQIEWSSRVAFPKGDGSGGIHWVLPSRLLSTETVFALTVHKSQGSEFEHCALLLPPVRNPILTRELVYTGITRGKSWFSLICIGNKAIVEEASARTVQRSGGLFA